MKLLRLYIDTSVVGGCLDRAYQTDSQALVRCAREGGLVLVVSDLLRVELSRAPREVQDILHGIEAVENVPITRESEALRDAYLAAQVVGAASRTDALHVALATVHRADAIFSWNFRQIVHFEKFRQFNSVNLREGYPPIKIRSPREFV